MGAWATKRIGDVAKTQYGLSESMNEDGKGFKIFRMGEVQDGRLIDTGRMKYADISRAEFEQYKLRTGDVLFNRTNSFELVGKTGIFALDGDYCFASYLVRVNLDRSKVLPKFLNYFMNSDRFQDSVKGKASKSINQANINATILSNELIRFPESLTEQQRIVGILDEAFEGLATAKANAEKNLHNARALFESHLHAVFTERGDGWVEHQQPLEALCEFIVDCEHKTAPTQEEGIPSIRTPNIGKGKLLLTGVYRVSEKTYKEWARRAEPMPGDLILAREAPAGNVAVIPENTRVCLGQRTVLIRPKRTVFEPEFLAWTLLDSRTQSKLLAHSRGATVQHVNLKDIRALDVGAIPPIPIQRNIVSAIADALENSERLASLYQRKIAALDELKRSLLHQAFTGQL